MTYLSSLLSSSSPHSSLTTSSSEASAGRPRLREGGELDSRVSSTWENRWILGGGETVAGGKNVVTWTLGRQ